MDANVSGREASREGEAGNKDQLIPSISAPKGGGAIRGIDQKFAVNPATGTASVSIPLPLSPGRSGFGPALSLSYDSGGGNGPFGLGWRLSGPSVTRKTDKGLPRYRDGEELDTFVLSDAEDLVPALKETGDGWTRDPRPIEEDGVDYVVQRYRPRIEGLFARIERWTNSESGEVHWRSVSKENVTTVYGRSDGSRIADPEDATRVYQWLIEESYDDKGNVVVYEYKQENQDNVELSLHEKNRRTSGKSFARRYLKRVKYGNREPHRREGWLFEAVFDYGEHDEESPAVGEERPWPSRPDAFSSFRAGFEIRTHRLCRRVLMFHHFDELDGAPLVRSLDFDFNENPVATYLEKATQRGYAGNPGGSGYVSKPLPPLEFEYTQAEIDETIRYVDAESLENLPEGLDGDRYRWVDLDGEGVPGILTEQADAWFYKRNLGGARFAPSQPVARKPSLADLQDGRHQVMDLAGDGTLDIVLLEDPVTGFYERNGPREWDSLVPFKSDPNVNWGDPNLRLIDLTGDGHADILVTEDEAYTFYPSLAEEGFGASEAVRLLDDEEKGPRLVFADAEQSVFLADMAGDGLTDIVRIRNGEICYWPNLGYGRFGMKVGMDDAPRFDSPDLFDPRRIRLADIDGSGTTDIVYLGGDGVRFWSNQSGNGWSDAHRLPVYPGAESLSSVGVLDLLGRGTACLVWSSRRPSNGQRPIHYIDLMGGQKPHLLVSVKNNMGAETRTRYAPSTRFYLEDRRAGRPWITRLPFPVHVVERVETYDRISRNRFVSRYAYHHGYFDGAEREFRGFGMVEQWDTERYSELGEEDLFPVGENYLDEASHVPPVHTKTWFHNGFFLDRQHISRQYADEYYGAPDKDDLDYETALAAFEATLLPDTPLPPELTAQEQREACRALKGRMLRQEVYGLDGTEQETYPYSVAETKYHIRRDQPKANQKHAVFYVCNCESLTYHYERNPADPRIAHAHTLEIDKYGNVLKAAAVAYPRRSGTLPEQAQMYVTYTESDFIHLDETPWTYRIGLPTEQRSYEIRGLAFAGRWEKEDLATAIADAPDVPYTAPPPDAGDPAQKRLLGHTRALYYRNTLDPDDPLPFGDAESLGLPHSQYRLAFTQDILDQPELGGRITSDLLYEGGYRNDIDGDPTHWWIPSGIALFDQEDAPEMFYLPVGSRDPFGAESHVAYDDYYLLPTQTTDPLGNTARARNDYRLLQPWELTDPNRNRTRVAFDALGMVIATAVVGRDGEGDPALSDPTTRFEYDLFAYDRTRNEERPRPNYAHTFARERHADPTTPWQETYAYSDGFGRVVMTKVQAEDGSAPLYDENGNLVLNADEKPEMIWSADRWVGSGATVFNNKGLPIKQYEPFFDSRPDYTNEEALVRIGVSPTLHYDPLGRTIRTELPDGSFSRVDFDPWRHISYDPNDTVRDSDWYAANTGPEATDAEREAAARAAEHHETPTHVYLDVLGRPFVSVAHNIKEGRDEFIPTRTELNIEGNPLAIYDGRRCEGLTLEQAIRHRGNTVMTYTYAMGGLQLYQNSMDAGERRALVNVLGNPIHGWDSLDQHVHTRYDELQRPTHLLVDIPQDDGSTRTVVAERMVYGEALPEVEARRLNLRGQLYLHFDGAGLVKNHRFDFKGNLLVGRRRLAVDYREVPDWTSLEGLEPDAMEAMSLLEGETFTIRTRYDALNRPVRVITPDRSVHLPGYNKANLLETVRVRLRGAMAATDFVGNIDYNARGQRTAIDYANGVHTTYKYDTQTFRLVRLHTTRAGGTDDLQDLHYTYDAVGNIADIRDDAIEPIFFRNERVEARSRYTYDPLYRLIEATGRESAGVTGMATHEEIPRVDRIPAHDRALRNYTQHYDYDPAGNILQMRHTANGGSWTRNYDYEPDNNRLRSHNLPGGAMATYAYDAHGSMQTMPHVRRMAWDYKDQLRHVDIATGQEAFFTYNSNRERVRKVWLHGGFRDERVYLGGYELYRRYRASGTEVRGELQTLHVMDDTRRICMVETPTIEDGAAVDPVRPRFRYQLANHLGSATAELDEHADVITYEEYHPYGTAAYHARNGTIEISSKRYRYTGMERDEETGLNYHTARYYAPWLGSWCSADPTGLLGGGNFYQYSSNDPINRLDLSGTQGSAHTAAGSGRTTLPLGRSFEERLEELHRERQREEERLRAVIDRFNRSDYWLVTGGHGRDPEPGEFDLNPPLPGGVFEFDDPEINAISDFRRSEVFRVWYSEGLEGLQRLAESGDYGTLEEILGQLIYYNTRQSGEWRQQVSQAAELAEGGPGRAGRLPGRGAAVASGSRGGGGSGAGGNRSPITDPNRLLTGGRGGETSETGSQVARRRGSARARGERGERHVAEVSGGTREVTVQTRLGRRRHDVVDPRTTVTETDLRREVKNYLPFRRVGQANVPQQVEATPVIRQQIRKDVLWIYEGRRRGLHRVVQWDFLGAPPSQELREFLLHFGIPFTTR